MNWNDKSLQIAEELLDKMNDGVVCSYNKDDILHALQQAAIKGMAFECENWVIKRKR